MRRAAYHPSPRSTTPAFSPGPWIALVVVLVLLALAYWLLVERPSETQPVPAAEEPEDVETAAHAEPEQADAEIKAWDWKGPLHGIPYGVKDLFSVSGAPTTWGSDAFKDQIIDGETGILIQDPADLEAFAWALRRLVDDPDLAARMGAASHDRVAKHFLAASRVADYVALIGLVEATADANRT